MAYREKEPLDVGSTEEQGGLCCSCAEALVNMHSV